MAHARAILEVSPSRITLAVVRAHKVTASRTHHFDCSEWPNPWTDALAQRTQALRTMVQDLECAGAHTTIIYSAPGSLASVVACPSSAGLANAERAARLALANVADFPIELSTSGTVCLLTETRQKNAIAPGIPNTHILVAADAEERTQPLCDWATEAELTPLRLINAECLAFADAVRTVTAKGEQSVRALLWFGEHTSVLVAGLPGRLLLIRSLSAGSEALVEALTATLRPAGSGAPGVTLSRDQARRVLHAIGVPNLDQPVPNHPELQGSALLPHLQPIIQRLSIEIKQSLRFSVPELLRPTVRLGIGGAGPRIPRLDEVLARTAGFPVLPADQGEHAQCLAELLPKTPDFVINVAPREVRAVLAARRVRTALMAGVGCAALLVGFEFISATSEVSAARAKLTQVTSSVQQRAGAADSLQRAVAAEAALRATEARVRTTLAEVPAWAELLAFLASAPPSLRLTSVELRSDAKAGHRAVLTGRVRFKDAPDAPAVINQFISTLSSVPLVDSVRLGGTQRGQTDAGEVQSFEINVALVGVPAPAARTEPATASASPKEAAP